MATATTRTRLSGPGVSPLLVVALVLVTLVVVEALLAARFWYQVNAEETSGGGLSGTVMDVSAELVTPFEGISAAEDDPLGNVERSTLIAAVGYVLVAIALVALTVMITGFVAGKSKMSLLGRRAAFRESTEHRIDFPPLTHDLKDTVQLRLTPQQTARVLRKLRVDRFRAEIVIIPAESGSMIAVFDDADGAPWSIGESVQSIRESMALNRILKTLARRFPPRPSPRLLRRP